MSTEQLTIVLPQEAPDAVVLADSEGRLRVWNRGAESIFGSTAEAALGNSLALIAPEHFRAAHLSGFHRALGSGSTEYAGKPLPIRAMKKDGIDGRIVHIDSFGNLITDIRTAEVKAGMRFELGSRHLALRRTYGNAGEACAIGGSSGYVEVALPGGNAAAALNATIGDTVRGVS